MFRYNFIIGLRNLLKNKVYSLINISGLAVSMAFGIIILLWVQHETSFDQFHADFEQKYRLTCQAGEFKAAVTPPALPMALKDEMHEITSTVRVSKPQTSLFQIGDEVFQENNILYADDNFLNFFSFTLIRGIAETALKNPNDLLLTEATALKYFGTVDAIGQVVKKDNQDNLTVTGVLANIPSNSHLQFDMILPMSHMAQTNRDLIQNSWDGFNFYGYVQVDKAGNSAESLEVIGASVDRVFASHFTGFDVNFQLQPLSEIHLHSGLQVDVAGHGNSTYVDGFLFIALFILIVACINFMNLSTARSSLRAKEVGLKKVVGARRGQLIMQFLVESMTITLLSLTVAIGMVFLLLPGFNDLLNLKIGLDLSDMKLWLGFAAVACFTGLLSGSYPAFCLSGFKLLEVLNGNLKVGSNSQLFRNGLVVMQFVVSTALLIASTIIYNQLDFLKSTNLGFEKENLIYMQMTRDLWESKDALEIALLQNANTERYTLISDVPANLTDGSIYVDWDGKDPNAQIVFSNMRIDENFIDVLEIELLAGRSYSTSFMADSSNFIINQRAAQIMGWEVENTVGQNLTFNGVKGKVIGLVKDFNFKPLQYVIEPLVLQFNNGGGYIVVKSPPNSTEASIAVLEKINNKLNPNYPMSYRFLDEVLNNQYQSEQQMGNIFNLFMILAIVISCLGLYGLSAFMAEQRIKEIGIRKVLGASTASLISHLSKYFIQLVLLALLIAIPLSWYVMSDWLIDFTKRIEISIWIFLYAGIGTLVITLLTVSYHVLTVVLMNPVKSLRAE